MKKYDVLYEYISENFSLETIGSRLVSNILKYAISKANSDKEMKKMLCQLLDLEEGELDGVKYDS